MKAAENKRPNAPTSALPNSTFCNVPRLRFPGCEGEWEKVKNMNLFLVSTEKNKKGENSIVLSASQTEGMVERNSLGIDIKYERDNILGYKVVRPGDYVIHLRSFQGGFAFSDRTGICSPAYTILRPTKALIYGFLRPYLTSRHFIDSLRLVTYGIRDGKSISVEEWLKSSTCIPPTSQEQVKITEFLSLIDKRIAIQNKTIEDLKKLKAALEEKIFASVQGHLTPLSEILVERVEKSSTNNQYEILSSTISGIYSQREYFNKDIASSDNTGYKVIHKSDIVLSPQNLWMGNINFNDKFDIGIVSPSYKVFSIRPEFDSRYVAFLLKTKRALWNYMLVSEQGASVVRRNLNIESFWGISFKIPSMDTQKRIGQGIRCIELKIEREMEYLAGLQKQKTFLLNNLFV